MSVWSSAGQPIDARYAVVYNDGPRRLRPVPKRWKWHPPTRAERHRFYRRRVLSPLLAFVRLK